MVSRFHCNQILVKCFLLYTASPETGGHVRMFEEYDESMNSEELCLWLKSKKLPKEDLAILRGDHISIL